MRVIPDDGRNEAHLSFVEFLQDLLLADEDDSCWSRQAGNGFRGCGEAEVKKDSPGKALAQTKMAAIEKLLYCM